MATISSTRAYESYIRCGVVAGAPLSAEEFSEFWDALPADEREYWVEQFEKGPSRLTKEFLEDAGIVDLDERSEELIARIRTAMADDT